MGLVLSNKFCFIDMLAIKFLSQLCEKDLLKKQICEKKKWMHLLEGFYGCLKMRWQIYGLETMGISNEL